MTRDEPAVERLLAAGEGAPAGAAEHLAPVPVRQQRVPQLAGLGVLLDEVEHLADVAEVAVGLHAPVGRVARGVAQRPVVARAVGEHGDAGGVEVGVHHEVVVLEPAPALGEADPVLEQHRRAGTACAG